MNALRVASSCEPEWEPQPMRRVRLKEPDDCYECGKRTTMGEWFPASDGFKGGTLASCLPCWLRVRARSTLAIPPLRVVSGEPRPPTEQEIRAIRARLRGSG